jgi:hypothetical protein
MCIIIRVDAAGRKTERQLGARYAGAQALGRRWQAESGSNSGLFQ